MSILRHDIAKKQSLVLIVDDEPVIVNSVTRYLNKLNYRVVGATNGKEGLDIAKANPPDIIICDIQMPVMDGYTMIRHLRILKEFAFTPILILTGHEDPLERRRGFQCGADDFMHKDHLFAEIEFRLTKALTASRMEECCTMFELRQMTHSNSDFTGQLDAFRLSSLITMCRIENTSGVLDLENKKSEKGLIYMQNGEVVSAKVIGVKVKTSEVAIGYMLSWVSGTFSLQQLSPSCIPGEISTSTDSLLQTAVTHTEEDDDCAGANSQQDLGC